MLQYMDSFLGWEYDHLPPNELLDVDTEGSFPSRAGWSSGVRRRESPVSTVFSDPETGPPLAPGVVPPPAEACELGS